MTDIVLSCKDLGKIYGTKQNQVQAVTGVNLKLQKGKFYCIIGKSGSGKTTLLHLLAGMEKPDSGTVWLNGVELSQLTEVSLARLRRRHIGFVFQDYQLLPELTVEENICLPFLLDKKEIDFDWLKILLEALSLTELQNRYPTELSGGEQQRTAVARAISQRPSILFADEPTGNLDKKTSEELLDFLLKLHRKYDLTILLVTHDLDIARCGDEILLLEDGCLKTVMKADEK